MLHGRENLKKELEIKSFVTAAFGTDNRNDPFHPSRKESNGDTAIAVPQSIWMNTFKGGKSGDTFEMAQIQVDKKVVVSDI